MGKYLVTGRAGSGKSAVCKELIRRGYTAFDSDEVAGLSAWHNKTDGTIAVLDDNSYVDLDVYEWLWNDAVLDKLLASNDDIFLCGGAENDLARTKDFDVSFVLDVSPDIQAERLRTRTSNYYGRDPRMLQTILDKQKQHVAEAQATGAHLLDATRPIEQVVDEILNKCGLVT